MAFNHGINTYKSETDFSSVKKAAVGIPFFIGLWPCHRGKGYVNVPQLARSFEEAKELGGYSKEWIGADGEPKWTLCEAMYSHFKLNGVTPAIFCNVFNPTKHKTPVSSKTAEVADHMVKLSGDVIASTLAVKNSSAAITRGKDYDVYYDDEYCYIELLSTGSAYSATTLSVSYDAADLTAISSSDIEAAVEKVEQCKNLFGIVPDLLCAPGWSASPTVAAVLDAKAGSINGLYKAKAVVDIGSNGPSVWVGVSDAASLLTYKNANGYTGDNMIVCWPKVKNGDYVFNLSTIVCGKMASIDADNGDCPYESPSNKSIPITGACLSSGSEISLTLPEADAVSYSAGIVTVLNDGGWVLWGNYTGCWPKTADVSKCFICTSRMMDCICNTFADTFRSYIDRPLTRVLIDAIVNSFNSFLNGLTAEGKLYGGEIQYVSGNNTTADLIGGKFRLDTKMASPVPAQRIDMYVEYDVDYLTKSINV